MPNLPEAAELKYGDECPDSAVTEVACVALSLKRTGRQRLPSVLILSECDIEEAGNEEELIRTCSGVRELDLSRNKLKKWDEVFKILCHLPMLGFLNLSYNSFDTPCKTNVLKLENLTRLVLNGTLLPWKDVQVIIGQTPRLEELHLCMNKYCSVVKSERKYATVKRIHFNNNPIVNWKELYSDEERRHLTIGWLWRIQRLNGGALITAEERDKSERAFIRYFQNREVKPNRYEELVRKHGTLDPLVDVSLKPETEVDVSVWFGDVLFSRTLNVYMRVLDVKKMLEPLIGAPACKMRLFYVDKGIECGVSYAPEELKINAKQLYTINVHCGDEFIVDIKK